MMRRRFPALALTIIAAMVPLAGCGDDEDSSSPSDEPAAESGSAYGGGSGGEDSGTSGGSGGSAASEAASVEIVEFAYAPVDVKVTVGGTIEWANSDTAPHTATANDDSFDTGSLDKGDSAKITFDEPGTFDYICTFHPFMNASVEVVE